MEVRRSYMTSMKTQLGITINSTPWDAKVFDVNTFEIFMPKIERPDINGAIVSLNEMTSTESSSLFYSRIDANFNNNKRALLEAGFHSCETQLHVINSNIKNYSTPKELGNKRLQIELANTEDYSDVINSSLEVFKYSRFHEDPFVDSDLANSRMKYWCQDLRTQAVPLLTYRNRAGDLDSFIFYKIKDNDSVELILGGSLPGKGMMTPLFWASFIEHFKALGVSRIESKISASNIAIVNIYIFFGFVVKDVYFDFHKHVAL